MINLLLGAPGGGKSYEAVIFHVLPAVERGRKVITNLPLNLEEFERRSPGSSALIQIIKHEPGAPRPFSVLEHYSNTWKGEGGLGPLYVIDECHEPLPRSGFGSKGTPQEIEEWFAMHRHEGADVLLLTQSYGKVSRNIVDLVQVVYRVRKNVALGSTSSYTRKVQDGIRGSVVNTGVRRYKKENYSLYKSHTRTNEAVQEAMTQDIVPFWKHWSVIGAVLMLSIGAISLYRVGNPANANNYKKPAPQQPIKPAVVTPAPVEQQGGGVIRIEPEQPQVPVEHPTMVAAVAKSPDPEHPYQRLGVHLGGYIESRGQYRYMFILSQNGQGVFTQSQGEIERAGYTVEPVNDCAARLTYGEWSYVAVCDAPSQSVALARSVQ